MHLAVEAGIRQAAWHQATEGALPHLQTFRHRAFAVASSRLSARETPRADEPISRLNRAVMLRFWAAVRAV